eukprot:323149-Rhodomonas_salina.3
MPRTDMAAASGWGGAGGLHNRQRRLQCNPPHRKTSFLPTLKQSSDIAHDPLTGTSIVGQRTDHPSLASRRLCCGCVVDERRTLAMVGAGVRFWDEQRAQSTQEVHRGAGKVLEDRHAPPQT